MENFFSTRDLNNKDAHEAQGSNSGFANHMGEPQFTMTSGGRDIMPQLRMPKMDFPRFDGDNPKSWLQKCEYYFQMNNVQDIKPGWQLYILMGKHLNGMTVFASIKIIFLEVLL